MDGTFAAVTVLSLSFVPSIPEASFASVTLPSAIFAVVTLASAILVVITELAASSVLSIALAAISVFVMLFSSMLTAPTARSAILFPSHDRGV